MKNSDFLTKRPKPYPNPEAFATFDTFDTTAPPLDNTVGQDEKSVQNPYLNPEAFVNFDENHRFLVKKQ